MIEPHLSSLERARLFRAYGYVADPKWDVLALFEAPDFAALKAELARRTRAELIETMWRTARAVFEQCFANPASEIVIPLSGGRDSRFILCMALECGLGARVLALTWGVPGGRDFEVARKVAAALGVRHVRIDITRQHIGFDDLRRGFDNGAHWTDLLIAHVNQLWSAVAPGARAIIGYLGGPVVGEHFLPDERGDFRAAVAAFEALNRRRPGHARMIGDVAHRLIDPDLITPSEQLDLVYRQEGYLRRIVAPPSFDLRAPFAHPDWMRFGYALPPHERVGGALYTDFLLQRFPRAFAIGTANAYGLRADASAARRRLAARLLRLRYRALNATRTRGFVAWNKYGDPRDLSATLAAGEADPEAYARALRRRPRHATEQSAAAWRAQAMLVCNLACAAAARAARPSAGDALARVPTIAS